VFVSEYVSYYLQCDVGKENPFTKVSDSFIVRLWSWTVSTEVELVNEVFYFIEHDKTYFRCVSFQPVTCIGLTIKTNSRKSQKS